MYNMVRLTTDEAIEALRFAAKKGTGQKYGPDNEQIHIDCDDILLQCVDENIAEEYKKIQSDIGFWYS